MDAVITFTPSQIVAICGAIITITGAVAVIVNLIMKAMAPNKLQNARLDAIELRLNKHDELFKNDLGRFESMDEGNRVTQKALLALLAHGIDGNDIENLKRAKDELQEYLIKKR